MQARVVTFSAAKEGNDDHEWEDGAAWSPGDPVAGRSPRVAVADGATGGFSAARWAEQLVTGFVGADGPQLEHDALHRWLAREQVRWIDHPRWAGLGDVARMALHTTGSFATLVACELTGLDGGQPRWRACALGDAVLFHVRRGRVLAQFPALPAEAFGYNPDGVPTRPDGLADMVSRLRISTGELAPGDHLFVATDAFAHWMVTVERHDPRTLWAVLAGLDHPDVFARLVADRRGSGELHNDDVTLMRVDLSDRRAEYLVVCL